ncbi:hypothetical protein PM082_009658 [Marasmius tenuissimus]|nr:hypothetical protein PM082_009658 [Marasmius tenuissimus]
MILVFQCFVLFGWRRKRYVLASIACCLIFNVMAVIFSILLYAQTIFLQTHPTSNMKSSPLSNLFFLESFTITCCCLHLLVNILLTNLIAAVLLIESSRSGLELTSVLIQVAGITPALLIVRANINKEKVEGDDASPCPRCIHGGPDLTD